MSSIFQSSSFQCVSDWHSRENRLPNIPNWSREVSFYLYISLDANWKLFWRSSIPVKVFWLNLCTSASDGRGWELIPAVGNLLASVFHGSGKAKLTCLATIPPLLPSESVRSDWEVSGCWGDQALIIAAHSKVRTESFKLAALCGWLTFHILFFYVKKITTNTVYYLKYHLQH